MAPFLLAELREELTPEGTPMSPGALFLLSDD